MIPATQPKALYKIADNIGKHLIKIELSLLAITLIGILINNVDSNIGEVLITFSLVTLATTYYFLAYQSSDSEMDRFLLKLIYFSYTVAIMSILFISLNWPGGLFIHQGALVAMLLALIGLFLMGKILNKTNLADSSKIIRTFILFLAVMLLYMTPGYQKQKQAQEHHETNTELTE